MKILQINAVYKTKSTGRIVYEMHHFFQNNGIDSYVAYATENTEEKADSNIFRIGCTFDHKLHALAYRVDKMQGCHSRIATRNLIKKIEKIRPDAVITHNLHSNYIHVGKLLTSLKEMNIPVILCLHDCWFMTGGCYHYTSIGCDGWLHECKNCIKMGKAAAKKFKMNKRIFDYVHPTIIATSKWIEREANESHMKTNSDIHMIYNWIDQKVFYPRNATPIRKKYCIDNRTMVLGVATGWSSDKGQKEMIQVAKSMPEARIVLVGHQAENADYPSNVITIDFTESKDELAQLYSAADVFFNPSKQETFGLVSGEALACGTPIVVFNTTACPEFVNQFTGKVINAPDEVLPAINCILQNNDKLGRDIVSQNCCRFVDDNFNMSKNLDKYISVLNNIINK